MERGGSGGDVKGWRGWRDGGAERVRNGGLDI